MMAPTRGLGLSPIVAAATIVGVTILGACSEDATRPATTPSDGGVETGGPAFESGEELKVPVAPGARAFVKLASPPSVVTPVDPKTDKGWDIAFEGLDVFTNSGPSGSGGAAAFGPLDGVVFLDNATPEVPFLTEDKAGGAFIRWYFYEGAPNHALHSRLHVFGVKEGDKLWKVQILTYYGKRDGAPVSALYKIRWAAVSPPGATTELADLDGTAGGASGSANAPSECLDLGTGTRVMHSPAEARTASDWHLCFRRQDISVNGALGGPRNVGAVDFDADKTPSETLSTIAERTPESELARFDAIQAQSFEGHTLRGDGIVSAFTGLWTERGVVPPSPAPVAWRVQGADAKTNYLVGFARFEGATAATPGTVVMRVKTTK